MAIMIKVLYGDVVLVSTRGRRSLFIFLIDIYLQSLPGCLLILFFFFFLIIRLFDGDRTGEWQRESGNYF